MATDVTVSSAGGDYSQGARGARLTADTGDLSHTFLDAQTDVWTDFHIKPRFGDTGGAGTPPENSTVAFFVNTNGQVIAFDGQTTTQLNNDVITQGDWVRFTVHSKYALQEWDLYMDFDAIAGGLGFYTNTAAYSKFGILNVADNNAAVDEINIGLTSPLPPNPGVIFMLR